jgi:hypothetical protein
MNPGNSPQAAEAGGFSPGQKVGGGRFSLVRFLGRGGMGIVWLAEDTRLGHQVALKFLPSEIRTDADSLDDMRRETVRSIKLTHSNIIRIHDLHEHAEELFIAMEFVDGSTVAALRREWPGRVMPWEEVRPLLRQLCDALDYAHGENVIHRDLKPANMMVDKKGRLRLADFGIAAVLSDSMSRVSLKHTKSGTMGYMSPQQMAGQRPQASDDIYALGSTVYELLTSRPPFYTGDIYHQVQGVAPQPMEDRLAELEIQNEIPAEVQALVMACLAKDPAQRPGSARAVAEWIGLEPGSGTRSATIPQPGSPEEPAPGADESTPGSSNPGVWMGVAAALAVLLGVVLWGIAAKRASARAAKSPATITLNPEAGPTRPATARESSGGAERKASLSPVPVDAGFVSLFNGRDLTGWTDEAGVWSVKDGILTAQVAANRFGSTVATNMYLIWNGGSLTDFELRFSCRMPDVDSDRPGNIGAVYRGSKSADNRMLAYELAMTMTPKRFIPGSEYGLAFLLELEGRRRLSRLGQKSFARPGGKTNEVDVGETITAADRIAEAYKQGDWNEITIIAEGNHFIHKVNGLITADVTDENLAMRKMSGLMALRLRTQYGSAIKGEYRDVRLKKLTR